VSRVDDQLAEFEAVIENAKARIAHGKHFPARQLAKEISALRKLLLQEYGTLDNVLDAFRMPEPSAIVELAQGYGLSLLSLALINPKALTLVGKAFPRLQDSGVTDPRANAIIDAYEHCRSFPPTFREFKRVFIDRFGERRWRSDFSMRKTLRFLQLPLVPSKRGRPRGSGSQIGNPRRLEQ
jgi:hypothetical protein